MSNLFANLKQEVSLVGGYLIGIGLIASLSILGYQAAHWIQNDKWLPLPFYKAIYYFDIDLHFVLNMEWQGAKNIIIWILELPLAVIVFVSSLMIGWILLAIFDRE